MLKPIIVFFISLLLLVPICIFVGYGIGEIIAAYVYPVTSPSDRYKGDRELFAGVYGIMFIGGFIYVASVAFAVFRLIKAIRNRPL
ncbi:hypothetical protein HGG72_16620 [Ochrobactrum pecoris]|uniref:Uncharacterized protein n=1 Tax=Brucella pecoris TaxID=867683 RepID=A0A5C5CCZ1_9HYPH|nr:hypothetical protein [Brucella pecoris]MBB4096053.1 hypothetical protein [Brucella pecoris]NKW81562.1 hypothetical protein [Brucella pecoris]TNV08924.1 hypothetical protein FIB18_22430 [Brucella pecoris]